MKEFQNVRGSQETVPSVEVGVDTVYIRSTVRRVKSPEFMGWEYDEVQYTLREYIEYLSNKDDLLMLDLDFRLTMLEH